MSTTKIREEQHKQYLQKYVNPIMEKLIVDLLISKPQDVLQFLQQWINEKGEKVVNDIKLKNQQLQINENENAYGEKSESEEDDDDDGEVLEMVAKVVQTKQLSPIKKNMRQSVSAEVYGKFNQKTSFVAKVIQKNPETYQRIQNKLLQAFMFSALDDKDRVIVINAMEEKKFKIGDRVIEQGDDGDILYLVDQGELDCFKVFNKDEEQKHLKVYYPGESFGELALLYNAPRAATIIAKTDAVLFALDRDCFNHIVKTAAQKKREGYEQLLSKIDILGEMDPYERIQIADALKPVKFEAGQYVVKEGEQGNVFFFVEEGIASAYKQLKSDEQPVNVMSYKSGDYFGELSLLRDQPRAASIKAESDLTLATLDRQTFKRLLGPLEDLLKRNFSKYQNYLI